MKYAIVNRNDEPNGIYEERGKGKYCNFTGGWKRFEDFEDCRLYKTREDAEQDAEDIIDLWNFWYEDRLESNYGQEPKTDKNQRPKLEVVQVKFVEWEDE